MIRINLIDFLETNARQPELVDAKESFPVSPCLEFYELAASDSDSVSMRFELIRLFSCERISKLLLFLRLQRKRQIGSVI
jgi:hypothetical protein